MVRLGYIEIINHSFVMVIYLKVHRPRIIRLRLVVHLVLLPKVNGGFHLWAHYILVFLKLIRNIYLLLVRVIHREQAPLNSIEVGADVLNFGFHIEYLLPLMELSLQFFT